MQSRKQTKILLDNASLEKVFAGARGSVVFWRKSLLRKSKSNDNTIKQCHNPYLPGT
tara:strand:- start:314 stop:484 length:171 start_codon:yes stop_codon:yes gene_type:complete